MEYKELVRNANKMRSIDCLKLLALIAGTFIAGFLVIKGFARSSQSFKDSSHVLWMRFLVLSNVVIVGVFGLIFGNLLYKIFELFEQVTLPGRIIAYLKKRVSWWHAQNRSDLKNELDNANAAIKQFRRAIFKLENEGKQIYALPQSLAQDKVIKRIESEIEKENESIKVIVGKAERINTTLMRFDERLKALIRELEALWPKIKCISGLSETHAEPIIAEVETFVEKLLKETDIIGISGDPLRV